ncbi:hypothetical protein [Wenjunlia tyrosinilytica]|nr:hypothetical protein [Wenjunlia tyrosinilytica]
MDTTRNVVLEAWMAEHGYSSNSLADDVNMALDRLTGRPGGLDGSSVRGWKAGRVLWPKSATRKALEDVSGLPAVALGYVPRVSVVERPPWSAACPWAPRTFSVSPSIAAALAWRLALFTSDDSTCTRV